jgi:hypothetical protein
LLDLCVVSSMRHGGRRIGWGKVAWLEASRGFGIALGIDVFEKTAGDEERDRSLCSHGIPWHSNLAAVFRNFLLDTWSLI